LPDPRVTGYNTKKAAGELLRQGFWKWDGSLEIPQAAQDTLAAAQMTQVRSDLVTDQPRSTPRFSRTRKPQPNFRPPRCLFANLMFF